MINTKTEMVSVFDERIIEERPWYVLYNEGDPIPTDPTIPVQAVAAEPIVEPETEVAEPEEDSVDKPKRKSWKEAIAEKAQELSEAEQAGDQTNTEANQ